MYTTILTTALSLSLTSAQPLKTGVTHGPAYYNLADLRIGGIEHITRIGEPCAFADISARIHGLRHVNERNATFCAAIGDLLPREYYNVS